jgi:hypothetical protein
VGTPSEGSSSVIDGAGAKIMKKMNNYENYQNIENNNQTYE